MKNENNFIYTSQQVSEIENFCFKNGMPVQALMEKASLNTLHLMKKILPKRKLKIGIFIGSGHNGGDALVIARELYLQGHSTFVFLANKKRKELTDQHLKYYKTIGGKVANEIKELADCEVLVDGLFGFGLNRSLEQNYINIINWINQSQKIVLSIDLPSGLESDLGFPLGACVKATHTFCLGFFKQGLFQDTAVDFVGKLHFIDLGISEFISNKALGINKNMNKVIDKNGINDLSLMRTLNKKRSSNKYTNGVALLFAGSHRYPGAAILACEGAAASGVGYVQLASDDFLKEVLPSVKPEIVLFNQDESILMIEKYIKYKSFTILIGPGLDKYKFLYKVISKINSVNSLYPSLVLDANSIAELKNNLVLFKKYKGNKIITPHLGEFKNLFPHICKMMPDINSDSNEEKFIDKIECAKRAASEINGVVVLKGPHTVIADCNGNAFVNLKSTPVLARAGTGDVLAGLITGLASQGLDSFTASVFGVYVHSQAAIYAEKKLGTHSVNAKELSHYLGMVIDGFFRINKN